HVPRHRRSRAHDDRVETRLQILQTGAGADLDLGLETGALGPHLLDAAVDVMLLELEVGDPVAQQPAEAVIAFVDDDRVPGPGQLLGAGRGTRSAAAAPPGAPVCRVRARIRGGGCGSVVVTRVRGSAAGPARPAAPPGAGGGPV